jgi:hypothetical protein
LPLQQTRHALTVRRREKQRTNQHQQVTQRRVPGSRGGSAASRGTIGSSSSSMTIASSRGSSRGGSSRYGSSAGSSRGSSRSGSGRGGSKDGIRGGSKDGFRGGNKDGFRGGSKDGFNGTILSSASFPPCLDMTQLCTMGRAAAEDGQIDRLEKLSGAMLKHIVSSPINARRGQSQSRSGLRGSRGTSAWSSSDGGAWSLMGGGTKGPPLPQMPGTGQWEMEYQGQQMDRRREATHEARTRPVTSPEEAAAHISSHLSNTGAVFWGDAVQAGWTKSKSAV